MEVPASNPIRRQAIFIPLLIHFVYALKWNFNFNFNINFKIYETG